MLVEERHGDGLTWTWAAPSLDKHLCNTQICEESAVRVGVFVLKSMQEIYTLCLLYKGGVKWTGVCVSKKNIQQIKEEILKYQNH